MDGEQAEHDEEAEDDQGDEHDLEALAEQGDEQHVAPLAGGERCGPEVVVAQLGQVRRRRAGHDLAQLLGAGEGGQPAELAGQPGQEEGDPDEHEQRDDRAEEQAVESVGHLPHLGVDEEHDLDEQQQGEGPTEQPGHRAELADGLGRAPSG